MRCIIWNSSSQWYAQLSFDLFLIELLQWTCRSREIDSASQRSPRLFPYTFLIASANRNRYDGEMSGISQWHLRLFFDLSPTVLLYRDFHNSEMYRMSQCLCAYALVNF